MTECTPATVDAKRVGIDERLRNEGDADAVEADTQFVDERRAEDVRLVDRHDLTVPAAPIGKARDRLALRVRFEARIFLKRVIEMEVVVLPQVVAGVDRVLIDGDRREWRTDGARGKGVRAAWRERVAGRGAGASAAAVARWRWHWKVQ